MKRPINVSLDRDLVLQARIYTRNLSDTLQDLPEAYIDRGRTRRCNEDAAPDHRIVDGLDAFHHAYGRWATSSRPSDG